MTDQQKTFSVINPIIWDRDNKPFSKDDLKKALKKEGALLRTSIGVTISEYVDNLCLENILIHLGSGLYQKNMDYITSKHMSCVLM